jgi:hypothetical protein
MELINDVPRGNSWVRGNVRGTASDVTIVMRWPLRVAIIAVRVWRGQTLYVQL